MKVVILSTFAFDANVSLINALKSKCEIYFFIEAFSILHNYVDPTNLTQLITKGEDVPELVKFRKMIPIERTFVIKGTRQRDLLKKMSDSYRINQCIKKINPDVVIFDNHTLTYFFSVLRFRNKSLYVVHDPFRHSGENFLTDRVIRNLYFRLMKSKLLLNETQKDSFVKMYGSNDDRIFTSNLGIYEFLNFFHEDRTSQNSCFNVLFFGRISPYKGIQYLLESFRLIIKEYPHMNISLTIAGGGKFNFDIEKYEDFRQIKILNRYLDPKELSRLIAESAVVVCPYTDATQSGVVMSSFAFNKPAIVTNVGGLPEMVEDGVTGLIVPPNDVLALKSAILELYEDSDKLRMMSKNIASQYRFGEKSWNVIAEDYYEILKKIIN